MMKYRLRTIISMCLISGYAYGQSNADTSTQTICPYTNTIQWPTEIQAGTEKTYHATVEWSWWIITAPAQRSEQSTFRITYDGNEIEIFPGISSFAYRFTSPWLYTISHEVTYQGCTIITSATIIAYEHSITYIGAARWDLDDTIINNLKQRNILVSSLPITSTNIQALIANKQSDINHSEIIIIDTTTPNLWIQQLFTQIQESFSAWSNAIFVTITDASIELSKKILGNITHSLKQPVHIINDDMMGELILLWRTGERARSTEMIRSTTQANNPQTATFGFNGFIDSLLYQGVPLAMIASMLSLVAITVILIFLRQVVWLNVFSIYYPILGAIALLLIGNKLSILFFGVARISHRITHLTAKRFHILIHAKIGIYLTIYTIMSISALWAITLIDPTIQRSYIQSIGTRAMIIWFMSLAIIGQKVFQHKTKITRHLNDIITYIAITIPIALIFDSTNIQYWMITHTRIVFLAIVTAFIMGRFTGMKLLEYKRFGKLLWKEIKRK